MGLFDDDDLELDAWLDALPKYPSCVADLNEANVQAIFDRCSVIKDINERVAAQLFFMRLGYDEKEAITIYFDKDILLKNKKHIEYLYGQLSIVHSGEYILKASPIAKFVENYNGESWTQNKRALLDLLYLGSNQAVSSLSPFFRQVDDVQYGDVARISPAIKPTLSPKDPAFPAWWEEHKEEWSEPK